MSKRKTVQIRAGDRIIFKDGIEKEGLIEEVSPSGTRIKIRYNEYRVYWFKWTVVVELLRPLPKKKRWFR